jgi:MerR family transcriptional regulator, light-induced transcriptional regulator
MGDRLRRPGSSACLAGWERPGGKGGERIFEILWSVEPDAVRDAARIGIELAASQWPELRERVPDWLAEPAELDDRAVQRATALTNRMLAYVTAETTKAKPGPCPGPPARPCPAPHARR